MLIAVLDIKIENFPSSPKRFSSDFNTSFVSMFQCRSRKSVVLLAVAFSLSSLTYLKLGWKQKRNGEKIKKKQCLINHVKHVKQRK